MAIWVRAVGCVGLFLLGCDPQGTKLDPLAHAEQALGVLPGDWQEQGPRSITACSGTASSDCSGATQFVVAHPTDPGILYIGASNGGVWRTENGDDPSPTWTALTDALPSLSIGALAMDASNPEVMVAVTGRSSSHHPPEPGGLEGFLYYSDSHGTSWNVIDHPTLRGQRLDALQVNGPLILTGSEFGNLYRSPDTAGTWVRLGGEVGSELPAGYGSVWDLAADPITAGRYYAVIGGAGLFRSDDSGVTWQLVSDNDTSSPSIHQALLSSGAMNAELSIEPGGRLFAIVHTFWHAAYIGYTDNAGAGWQAMDIPRYFTSGTATIASASNTNPIVITTSANHNLPLGGPLGATSVRVRIADVEGNTAANGDWMAAAATPAMAGDPPPPNQFVLLNRVTGASSDGTCMAAGCMDVPNTGTFQTWGDENAGGQANLHDSIAVDTADHRYVYVGGDAGNLYVVRGDAMAMRDPNAIPSAQWTAFFGSDTAGGTGPHADTRRMVLNADDEVVLTCDGGVFRRTSPHGGGDWIGINGNLGTAELHDIAYDLLSHVAMGGTQDNGTVMQSATGALPWFLSLGADGGDVMIDNSDSAESVRYQSSQGIGSFQRVRFDSSNVFIAVDNVALTVKGSMPPVSARASDGFQFVTPYAVNRVDGDRIVIAGATTIWEGESQGDVVTALGVGALSGGFTYGRPGTMPLADLLWASGGEFDATGFKGGRVFARFGPTDPLANTDPVFPGGYGVDVVVSPGDDHQAYVTDGFNVYSFLQASPPSTWDTITGDLQTDSNSARNVHALEYVPSTLGDRLVAAADEGVFMAAIDNPTVWSRVGENLPRAPAYDLAYDADQDLLVVGTMGRGAWTLADASQLDRSPVARCRDRTLSADISCQSGVSPADVDNGSFDPDGDGTTLSVSPAGPFSLGTRPVTLTILDEHGASATCVSQVTVIDTTPPVLGPVSNVTRALCDPNGESITLTAPSASDNCTIPTVTGVVISSTDPTLPVPFTISGTTVVLSAGVHTIRWTASDGVNTSLPVLQTVTLRSGIFATQAIDLRDRAKVQLSPNVFASILNSGTGQTHVGVEAKVGDILSRGPVVVNDRATIQGFIRSAGSVQLGNQLNLIGPVVQNTPITFPATFIPTTTFLGTSTNVDLQPNQTQPVAPGRYNRISVKAGSQINLSAGEYWINQLLLEPQSRVAVNQSGGTVRINVQTTAQMRGDFTATPNPVGFLFAFFGTAPTLFERPFSGIVAAPNAPIALGGTTFQTFSGQFYVKSFEVRPDVTVICRGDF